MNAWMHRMGNEQAIMPCAISDARAMADGAAIGVERARGRKSKKPGEPGFLP
ncbi:hypothetical protein [Caballeronia telluris]|uniref:hypothetical protein n=1 Tax=Caballeronia telluris TaxID=326475 RepID=UPI00190E6B08|nr:hypothetical protein [Caballeronia telluris]